MDPVTHGIIGLALASFSGSELSLMNPISLGCALGAMSPDIDIVAKIKGDYAYLKHHRGMTHSILGLGILAGIITLSLSFFYTDFNFLSVFLWSLLGCFSHSFFDILNSHGVRIFWPFYKKKVMLNLLMLYDPVVIILSFMLIFTKEKSMLFYQSIVFVFLTYLAFRLFMRAYTKNKVTKYYCNEYNILKVNILPALIMPYKWDIVIDTEAYSIVGQFNMLSNQILEIKKLKKQNDEIIKLFEESNIGRYFKNFTPNYHVTYIEKEDNIILKSMDLRYFMRNNFMHHATAIYDYEKNIIKSILHPYNINRNIYVNETK